MTTLRHARIVSFYDGDVGGLAAEIRLFDRAIFIWPYDIVLTAQLLFGSS